MRSGYMVCQICESYHDSVDELNAHNESDHPTGSAAEKKFPCKLCDKSFTKMSNVYRHQKKEHGQELLSRKPNYQGKFPCEVCGKKLSSQTKLKYHMKAKHNIQQ